MLNPFPEIKGLYLTHPLLVMWWDCFIGKTYCHSLPINHGMKWMKWGIVVLLTSCWFYIYGLLGNILSITCPLLSITLFCYRCSSSGTHTHDNMLCTEICRNSDLNHTQSHNFHLVKNIKEIYRDLHSVATCLLSDIVTYLMTRNRLLFWTIVYSVFSLSTYFSDLPNSVESLWVQCEQVPSLWALSA